MNTFPQVASAIFGSAFTRLHMWARILVTFLQMSLTRIVCNLILILAWPKRFKIRKVYLV